MEIRIINYSASGRDHVQAFIDLELNGWLRLNGIHFQRDGTLRSAQLTPMRNGRRVFLPAVEVLDGNLRDLLTAEILAAIHAHVESLPAEKRMRPPRPRVPREQSVNVQRPPEKPAAALHAPPANAMPEPERPTPKTLPPPIRLLVGRR